MATTATTTTITPVNDNNEYNLLFHVKRARVELDAIEWMILKVSQRSSAPAPAAGVAEFASPAAATPPFPSAAFLGRIEAVIETVAGRLQRELPEAVVGVHLKRALVVRLADITEKWRALLAEDDLAATVAASSSVSGLLPIATEVIAGMPKRATVINSTTTARPAAKKNKTIGGGGSTGDGSPSSASNSSSYSSSAEEAVPSVEDSSVGVSSVEGASSNVPASTTTATTPTSNPPQSSETSNTSSHTTATSTNDEMPPPVVCDVTLNGEDFDLFCRLLEAKTNIELLLAMQPLPNGRLVAAFVQFFEMVDSIGKGDDQPSPSTFHAQWETIALQMFARYKALVSQWQQQPFLSSESSSSSSLLTSLSSISMSMASLSSLSSAMAWTQQQQLLSSSSAATNDTTVEDSTVTNNSNSNHFAINATNTTTSGSSSMTSTSSAIDETLKALDRSITVFLAMHCPAPEVVQRKIAQLERHISAIPASERSLAAHWQEKLANIRRQFRQFSPAVSSADEEEDGEDLNRNQMLVGTAAQQLDKNGPLANGNTSSSGISEAEGNGDGQALVLNSTTTSAMEQNNGEGGCDGGGQMGTTITGGEGGIGASSAAHLSSSLLTTNGSNSGPGNGSRSSRSGGGLQGLMEADLHSLLATIEADIEAAAEEAVVCRNIIKLSRLVEAIGLGEAKERQWAQKVAGLIERSLMMVSVAGGGGLLSHVLICLYLSQKHPQQQQSNV